MCTHAPNLHAYAYTGMCVHAKLWKESFYASKLGFGMNLTLFESRSKPPFSDYKNPYMVHIKNTQKILRESIRFTRNSELKREFFTKYPQANIYIFWLRPFLALIFKFQVY